MQRGERDGKTEGKLIEIVLLHDDDLRLHLRRRICHHRYDA